MSLFDLCTEDGSFHKHTEGVFHHGFDPEALATLARHSGFIQVDCCEILCLQRPNGRSYPLLLLRGTKA